MKKQMFILSLVIVLLFTEMIASEAQIRPNLIVSGFSIKDGSATVGKDFTLSLIIKNIEPAACANTITTSIRANYPFILKGITAIPAGDLCKGASAVVDFPMKIDPTASGGSYQLTVTNDYETTTLAQFSSSDTINLFINGTPEIKANIVGSSPLDIYPGDTATLTVNIENAGTFRAQSLNANLKADTPIEVTWSKSFSSLGLLDAKQSRTADFSVEVPKDAKANDYNLNLEVQYLDENLASQTRNFPLMLHVKEKAAFETSDAGADTLFANDNSKTVRLLLKNTGTDAARKIKASILPRFPFSTDGSLRYIDIIEPGKAVPVQFTVNVDKDATPGTYALDMLLDFEDAQGNSLQDKAKVSLTVESKGFLRAVVLDYWFIFVAILAIAAIIVRRRARAKSKKKIDKGK